MAGGYNSALFTPGQRQFINVFANQTGLDPGVVAAQVYNESNINTAGPHGALAREQARDFDWLNIGRTGSGNFGANDAIWRNPQTAAIASANWIKGVKNAVPGYGYVSPGIRGIMKAAGLSPLDQIRALQGSGWVSGDPNVVSYPKLQNIYRNVTAGYQTPFGTLPSAAQQATYTPRGSGTPAGKQPRPKVGDPWNPAIDPPVGNSLGAFITASGGIARIVNGKRVYVTVPGSNAAAPATGAAGGTGLIPTGKTPAWAVPKGPTWWVPTTGGPGAAGTGAAAGPAVNSFPFQNYNPPTLSPAGPAASSAVYPPGVTGVTGVPQAPGLQGPPDLTGTSTGTGKAVPAPTISIDQGPYGYAAPPVTAATLPVPSNWKQLETQAIQGILNAGGKGLDYNTLLNAAMISAYNALAGQLGPLQQQYLTGQQTIQGMTNAAVQAQGQVANQIGGYYDQAAAETQRVSDAVRQMLGSQNPQIPAGISPDQTAAIQQQQNTTFQGGGNVLGAIEGLGVPGLAQDRAAALSAAALLPQAMRTQESMALANLGASTQAAMSKVLAQVPGLATKIASGELAANKAKLPNYNQILGFITGNQKFNATQTQKADAQNIANLFKTWQLQQGQARLNTSAATLKINSYWKQIGAQQRDRSLDLQAQNMTYRQWYDRQTLRYRNYAAQLAAWKAKNPQAARSVNTNLSTSEFNDLTKWHDGWTGSTIKLQKDPRTNTVKSIRVPVKNDPLNYGDAVAREQARHPNWPHDLVLSVVNGFYGAIGNEGRPLDPLMVDALASAPGNLPASWIPRKYAGTLIATLTTAQVDALRKAGYVQGTLNNQFIVSTGQQIHYRPDAGGAQTPFVIDARSSADVPGGPVLNANPA